MEADNKVTITDNLTVTVAVCISYEMLHLKTGTILENTYEKKETRSNFNNKPPTIYSIKIQVHKRIFLL